MTEGQEDRRHAAALLRAINHEVRSPMSSVIGFADLCIADASPGMQDQVGKILSGASLVVAILERATAIEQLLAGMESFVPEPVDYVESVEAVSDRMVRERGLAADVELVFHTPPSTISGTSDRRLVEDMVAEIVGNAIQYTQTGSIHVHVRDNLPAPGSIEIEVSDSGPGISESDLGLMRESLFAKLGSRRTSKPSGTRLGFSYARAICGFLGGAIAIASTSEGTRVIMQFPASPNLAAPE